MQRHDRIVITIKQVALKAAVSVATVSYALRNHPKIPPATRVRIQAVAKKLGYRPNPRVASLMAHIRQAHARTPGERLAFVWVHTSREQVAREPFLRRVFDGANQRAKQMGFKLEEFWTDDPGMSDQRLQQIILARGITGVVLSPVTTSEASIALEWDWNRFAAAVIGNVLWTPELNHAGHHHYLGMRTALTELEKLGCVRPAAIIEGEINARARRAWEAAFLTCHPTLAASAELLCLFSPTASVDVPAWVESVQPDALILSSLEIVQSARLQTVLARASKPLITLHWSTPKRGVGGIDQGYDRIAASAVDLVITQLNSNETGIPDYPRMLLFPGRWVAPAYPRTHVAV